MAQNRGIRALLLFFICMVFWAPPALGQASVSTGITAAPLLSFVEPLTCFFQRFVGVSCEVSLIDRAAVHVAPMVPAVEHAMSGAVARVASLQKNLESTIQTAAVVMAQFGDDTDTDRAADHVLGSDGYPITNAAAVANVFPTSPRSLALADTDYLTVTQYNSTPSSAFTVNGATEVTAAYLDARLALLRAELLGSIPVPAGKKIAYKSGGGNTISTDNIYRDIARSVNNITDVGSLAAGSISPGFGSINIDDESLSAGVFSMSLEGATSTIAGGLDIDGITNLSKVTLNDLWGTSGQVLKSNGTGTAPTWGTVATGVAVGDAITSGTAGSALFVDASGNLGQDNANFFWDDTSNFLGIGTDTPVGELQVVGHSYFTSTDSDHTVTISGDGGTGKGLLVSGTLSIGDLNAVNAFDIYANKGASISNSTGYSRANIAAGTLAVQTAIGIGTTTPATALSVVGNATVSGVLNIGGTSLTNVSSGALSMPSGGAMLARFFQGSTGSAGTNDYIDLGNSNGSGIKFYSAGTQAITLDSSGRLGIGTTTPNGLLTIGSGGTGASNPRFSMNGGSGTNGGPYIAFEKNSVDKAWIGPASALEGGTSDDLTVAALNDNALRFWSSGAEKMRIDTSGNVGIGTTTPYAKLAISNTGSGNSFLVEDDTNPDSTPFVIDASGNVGIGTSSPSTKLSVAGTFSTASGGLSVDANGVMYFNNNVTTEWPSTGMGIGQRYGLPTIFNGASIVNYSSGGIMNNGGSGAAYQLNGPSGVTMSNPSANTLAVGNAVGDSSGTILASSTTITGDSIFANAAGKQANFGLYPINLGNSGSSYSGIGYNVDFQADNTYDYKGNDTAFFIHMGGNGGSGFDFKTAPSGTTGNEITFTTQMQLLHSGIHTIGSNATGGSLTLYNSQGGQTTLGNSRALSIRDGNGANGNRTEIGIGYSNGSSYQPVVIGSLNTEVGDYTKGTFYVATRDVTTNTAPTERFTVTTAGNVGIGTTTPARLLHVYRSDDGAPVRFEDSNGYCEIDPTSTSWTCTSDERLKENIVSLSNASILEQMRELRPVSFAWKSDSTHTDRTGFIAQEVEQVFPEFVTTDTTSGLKSVAYGAFVPYIVSAIQELSTRLDTLAEQVEQHAATVFGWMQFKNDDLCVDEVCVTKEQFKDLLRSSGGVDREYHNEAVGDDEESTEETPDNEDAMDEPVDDTSDDIDGADVVEPPVTPIEPETPVVDETPVADTDVSIDNGADVEDAVVPPVSPPITE